MSLTVVGLDLASAFYLRQAGQFGAPVLVLGAADGRVALAIANRGERVVAVDPSARLLEVAKERSEGEPGAANLTWIEADLRSWRSKEKFPLIIAPQNAFGLLPTPDDLDAALAVVRAQLSPEGAFVFDVRCDAALEPGEMAPPSFAHFSGRAGGHVRRFQRRVYSLPEVEEALDYAGLEARERFGDFLSHPFEDTDELQVVIAGFKSPG